MLVPTRVAAKALGVHANTLRKWADEGKIPYEKTPFGQRRFDLGAILSAADGGCAKVCYCRVSSAKQRDDLNRQIKQLSECFPDHEIIQDIGSGLNFKRKGFISLLERVLSGDVKEIVVAHKDRLCRFGFDLIEWLVQKNGGRIVVLNDTSASPQQELIADVLSILHVFSCRMHGLRKYGGKIKEDPDLPNCRATEDTQTDSGDLEIHV